MESRWASVASQPWVDSLCDLSRLLSGLGRATEFFNRNSVADACGHAAGAGAPPDSSWSLFSSFSIECLSILRHGELSLHATFKRHICGMKCKTKTSSYMHGQITFSGLFDPSYCISNISNLSSWFMAAAFARSKVTTSTFFMSRNSQFFCCTTIMQAGCTH